MIWITSQDPHRPRNVLGSYFPRNNRRRVDRHIAPHLGGDPSSWGGLLQDIEKDVNACYS